MRIKLTRDRPSPAEVLQAYAEGKERLFEVANAVIEYLCRSQKFENSVVKYVTNTGGNFDKAQDVIEDGLLKLSEIIRRGKYRGGNLEALALQICKNTWLNTIRKKDAAVDLYGDLQSFELPDPVTPETILTDAERKTILKKVLTECLDSSCRQLLHFKIIEGKSHAEIAQLMGLSNANSSKEKLNRCKKKALQFIEQNPKYDRLLQSIDLQIKSPNNHD